MLVRFGVSEKKVDALLQEEKEKFEREHQKSKELYAQSQSSLVRGVPMHWMANWASPFPVFYKSSKGARLKDVDGKVYTDFCLGDTGAMFGHGNDTVAKVIKEQVQQASTVMLPSEEAVWVGEELQRRFGLPYWQFTTSATDANRFAIRIARLKTGRDKVLVYNGKYHGSIDETQVAIDKDGNMVRQPRVSQNAVDFDKTTKVVEFNDVEALELALKDEDVACVLAEPIMTNVGMVPPQPGYLEELREITRKTGTLLIIDETHTISTGPRGYTGAYNLEPDIFVLGKGIAGGIPAAIYGMSEEIAQAMHDYTKKDGYAINHCGFGGTLAGNVLTVKALRETLENVMTDEVYDHMFKMAQRFEDGVQENIDKHNLPWHVTRIGSRVEYMFNETPPINGREAKDMRHPKLEAAIHLYLLNRGVLLTPFHSMALMCPYTNEEDVDKHTNAFAECLDKISKET